MRLASAVVFALLVPSASAQPLPPLPNADSAMRYPVPGAVPPGAPAAHVANLPQPAGVAPPIEAPPPGELFQPGQIVARVGDKTILYGDVLPLVNLTIAVTRSPAERQSLVMQREALIRYEVMKAVQNKMLLLEFERSMPSEIRSDAKKRAEAEGKLRKSVREAFDRGLVAARERVEKATDEDLEELMSQDPTMVRLALLMKQRGIVSHGELDLALRQLGTTLAQQSKEYGEHMMGMEAARKALGLGNKHDRRYLVTHQEMIDYYQEHLDDFRVPAKATFEILTARFSRFNGDRQATHAHAAMMGNEVYLGGVPFPAVAKKHSHEPLAADGGLYEDISPGSLASRVIDQAVFSLEVNKLSQIIEDEQGFHILRVKQRQPAGIVPFETAQEEVRKKIEAKKRAAEQQKYLTELRNRTKIWTIYDPPEKAQNAQ